MVRHPFGRAKSLSNVYRFPRSAIADDVVNSWLFEQATSVSGTIAVTESGSDAASAAGGVLVQGAIAVDELGSDAASGSGAVVVSGAVAVTEIGPDTVTATGGIRV